MELTLQDKGGGIIDLVSYDKETEDLMNTILTKSSLNIKILNNDGAETTTLTLGLKIDKEVPYLSIIY